MKAKTKAPRGVFIWGLDLRIKSAVSDKARISSVFLSFLQPCKACLHIRRVRQILKYQCFIKSLVENILLDRRIRLEDLVTGRSTSA
jgi:hypothetical protein